MTTTSLCTFYHLLLQDRVGVYQCINFDVSIYHVIITSWFNSIQPRIESRGKVGCIVILQFSTEEITSFIKFFFGFGFAK